MGIGCTGHCCAAHGGGHRQAGHPLALLLQMFQEQPIGVGEAGLFRQGQGASRIQAGISLQGRGDHHQLRIEGRVITPPAAWVFDGGVGPAQGGQGVG